jgi:calcineurin-like phosphoesterase family protein
MDYVVSDLHLDHRNIIDYCDRPFASVDEMNETLIENWNAVVDPGDEVLYGGDLTIRESAAALLDWLEELHGQIVFVSGTTTGPSSRALMASTSSRRTGSSTGASRFTEEQGGSPRLEPWEESDRS